MTPPSRISTGGTSITARSSRSSSSGKVLARSAQLLHRFVLVVRQQALQLGQLGEGLTQAGEVARAGRAQGETGQHPLHIADLTQQVAQLVIEVLLDELLDGALATF